MASLASGESCANPLLLSWVKEWWDTAKERNSKGATTYKHAYDSLKACPITFSHPSELQQLKGFGPKLCDRLTDLLKKHCEENGLPMPQRRSGAKRKTLDPDQDDDDGGPSRPAKKAKKPKSYCPAYRSGAHALIVALSGLDEGAQAGLTKAELVEQAQAHCDASFTAPSDPNSFYTAWNSMKTLEQKELVYQRGRPLRRYCLTDEGWEVAGRIKQAEAARANHGAFQAPPDRVEDDEPALVLPGGRVEIDILSDDERPAPREDRGKKEFEDVVADGSALGGPGALPAFDPITLAPGTFTVHMVLDFREVRAKTDRDYMQEELNKKGVKPIMRSLELGDVLWVAKCHDATLLARCGAEGDEVVLDWVAERKRLDDLIGSIKDGRFHEQKFRLRRSGVKNVIYIVEEMSLDGQFFQKYEEAVQSAIASTQVVNGFFVKKTQKMDDTIRYLARTTALLKQQYEGKPLRVIPTKVLTAQNYLPLLAHLREQDPAAGHYVSYPAFASLVSKSDMMTLRDLYLKMLMCTKGVTGDRALEIQKRWTTPYQLVKAFEGCGPGEAGDRKRLEMVSSQLSSMVARKKITKALSQKIAEVWGGV